MRSLWELTKISLSASDTGDDVQSITEIIFHNKRSILASDGVLKANFEFQFLKVFSNSSAVKV